MAMAMVSQSRFAAAEVFRLNAAAAKFGQLKETLPILAISAVNFLLFLLDLIALIIHSI